MKAYDSSSRTYREPLTLRIEYAQDCPRTEFTFSLETVRDSLGNWVEGHYKPGLGIRMTEIKFGSRRLGKGHRRKLKTVEQNPNYPTVFVVSFASLQKRPYWLVEQIKG